MTGCTAYATYNKKDEQGFENPSTKHQASLILANDRGSSNSKKALVILALSGGGSRAAYLATSSMFALSDALKSHNVDVMKEVDAISAVSGGALPAAYYVTSYDVKDIESGKSNDRAWNASDVKELMKSDFQTKWILNWFWPHNIAKYWLTAYDRTDTMAETLSSILFNKSILDNPLTFKELNPERPNIILNSTQATRSRFFEPDTNLGPNQCRPDYDNQCSRFGDIFTFTSDEFTKIKSDIDKYDIGRAVMASASFPAVFNHATLYNYNDSSSPYIHLFDGGNSDNLGLESTKEVISKNIAGYDRIILILVDAYIEPLGTSSRSPDARNLLSYIVDTNFIDSSDSLLKQLRYKRVNDMSGFLDCLQYVNNPENCQSKQYSNTNHLKLRNTMLFHIKLQDKGFSDNDFKQLNSIQTEFRINNDDATAIDRATNKIVNEKNPCLRRILEFLKADKISDHTHVNCSV